jgi:hypothetical protein
MTRRLLRAVVLSGALALAGTTVLAQTPPAKRPAPTGQRPRPTTARPVARPTPGARPVVTRPVVTPRPVVVRPTFQPYRPPWIVQHLGIILGVGIPLLVFGLSIIGALVRKARSVPKLHRARTRFAEFRQTLQRESKLARDAMDARQQRALFNFSAQEYAAAASDLVSICTQHREALERVETEARQISRTLDAIEATEGEREAEALADQAEREQSQLEEYGERLTAILRERLDALTALQQAQVAAGQAPAPGRAPQMTISTMAAMADSRVHCRTCGGPLDPRSGAATCAYCGSPIVQL